MNANNLFLYCRIVIYCSVVIFPSCWKISNPVMNKMEEKLRQKRRVFWKNNEQTELLGVNRILDNVFIRGRR